MWPTNRDAFYGLRTETLIYLTALRARRRRRRRENLYSYDDDYTMLVHKMETGAATIELVACIGWIWSWWATVRCVAREPAPVAPQRPSLRERAHPTRRVHRRSACRAAALRERPLAATRVAA